MPGGGTRTGQAVLRQPPRTAPMLLATICLASQHQSQPPSPSSPSIPPRVCTQVPDVGEAMDLGLKAATLISQKFPPPVKLEFEKVRGKEGVTGI